MTTILGLYKKVDSIKLRDQIIPIIKETEDVLISLNQDQLYYLGTEKDGTLLQPYRPYTIQLKEIKGQPTDRTTLFDTGSFYEGFTIRTDGNLITFDSKDDKTQKLEAKYGNQIFGLTKENLTVYSFGAFYNAVKKHIQEKSGLQFT